MTTQFNHESWRQSRLYRFNRNTTAQYERALFAYNTGQMTEAEFAGHLRDDGFRGYVRSSTSPK